MEEKEYNDTIVLNIVRNDGGAKLINSLNTPISLFPKVPFKRARRRVLYDISASTLEQGDRNSDDGVLLTRRTLWRELSLTDPVKTVEAIIVPVFEDNTPLVVAPQT
jgi:hypothetical protein